MLSSIIEASDVITIAIIIVGMTAFFSVTLVAITRSIRTLGDTINYTREYDLMEHIVILTAENNDLKAERDRLTSDRGIQESQVELAESKTKAAIAERDAALLRVHRLMTELQTVNDELKELSK